MLVLIPGNLLSIKRPKGIIPTRSKINAQTKDADEACIFLIASNSSTAKELKTTSIVTLKRALCTPFMLDIFMLIV